jgi:hypothetical protein
MFLYRYIPACHRKLHGEGGLSAADNRQLNVFNERLQKLQYERGRTFVSRTTLFHRPQPGGGPTLALRAVITNPFTTEAHMEAVLADQATLAEELEEAAPEGEVAHHGGVYAR